jgi:hypothetical protein
VIKLDIPVKKILTTEHFNNAKASVEMIQGSSQRHRIVRISNDQEKPLYFIKSNSRFFDQLFQNTPLSMGKINKFKAHQKLKIEAAKKSKHLIEVAKSQGIYRIKLHLIDLPALYFNESIEFEIEFEHKGPHQLSFGMLEQNDAEALGISTPIFFI